MPDNVAKWGLAADSGQCRLCGSSESQQHFWFEVYASSGQQLRRCGYCAAVYLAPGFTEAGLVSFYSQRYRHLFPAEVPWLNKSRFFSWRGDQEAAQERLSLIMPCLAPKAALFEMGSGFGAFLGEAGRIRNDLDLKASEPDLANRSALLAGAHVQFIDQMQVLAAGSLDGVVAFHVLEHLISPRAFLETAADTLRVGGQLWIEVPDLMTDWRTRLFVHPAHLTYFCADSLRRLAEAAGFEVISCGPHPSTSLGGALWLHARRSLPALRTALRRADPGTIKAVDLWIERVGWTNRDRSKALLKRWAMRLLGPGPVGELQRWRQHRARVKAGRGARS